MRAWRRYLEFFGRTPRQDLTDELRFHFETEIEELVAAGRSPEEARREALAKFGDVDLYRAEIEATDARRVKRHARVRLIDVLRQDLRYTLRGLANRPLFAAACVGILAIGVGANAATFYVVDHLFLRPPGNVRAPEEVRRIYAERQRSDGSRYFQVRFSLPEARLMDSVVSRGFRSTIFFRRVAQLQSPGGASRRVSATWVTPTYFPMLGVRLHAGTNFGVEDTTFGVPAASAIISWALWEQEFGSDPDVLGRTIRVSGLPVTVRGITQQGFTGIDIDATHLWLPLAGFTGFDPTEPRWYASWGTIAFQVLARVPPGASQEQLVARVEAALRAGAETYRLAEPRGQMAAVSRVIAAPVVAALGPENLSQREAMAVVLSALALLLLIIAIANVANLILGRALDRRREIAVRVALGMDRARLVSQIAVESLVLTALATLAAAIAAAWAGGALQSALLPRIDFGSGPMDARVAALTISLGLVAAIVATAVSLQSTLRLDVTTFLKLGRDGGVHRSRLRSVLVAVQAALSVVLLVGTGLLGRSLYNVRTLDLGFDVDRLVTVDIRDGGARADEVATVARRLPGVAVVARTVTAPLWDELGTRYVFTRQGDTVRSPEREFGFVAADHQYLLAMGTRILRGRGISPDDRASSAPVMVVSEEMARRVWPGRDPLSTRECLRITAPRSPCHEIIGIAENAHRFAVVEQPRSKFYIPFEQRPAGDEGGGPGEGTLVVRATDTGDPRRVAAYLRSQLGDTATNLREQRVRIVADIVAPQYQPWEMGARLFAILAALALGLALFGLYAVLDYMVTLRRRELGVRLALGADRGNLVALVVGEGVRLVSVGAAAGVVIALLAAQRVTPLLYGVSPRDPAVILAAVGVLLLCALVGAAIPARRAVAIDPVRAISAD